MGGARVKSVAPLRRDSELPLRVDIPEKLEPLRCLARVVWSKPNGAAGLRFTNLPEDQKAFLSGWIQELQDAASSKGHRDDEFTRITAQVKNMKLNNADALSLIARRATQIAGASAVIIALGKAEHMVCMARAGEAPEIGEPVPALGLTGECTRSRKVVHCVDASTDPRAGDLKQGSAMIVPLLVNGELRGVMQVFAPRAGIFTAQRSESLEDLADAVLFVTHNVMPRVRPSSTGAVAKVTQMPLRPAASAPMVAKPSDSGRMAATASAPAVAKPSDSGRVAAFATGLPSSVAPSPAPEPMFVAPEMSLPVAPLAAAVQPAVAPPVAKPTFEEHRWEQRGPAVTKSFDEKRAPARVAPVYVPAAPRSSGTGKLLIGAATIVVVFSVAFGIRSLRHKPASQMVAVPITQAQLTSKETPAPSSAQTVTITAEEPAPSAISKPSALKEVQPARSTEKIEKKAALIEKSPEPAPMVLASGAPVRRAVSVEPDSAPPPSAPISAAAMPGINLPNQAAAPKLAAPKVAKVTGGTLLEHPQPVYPQMAIAERLEGQVKLQVTITPAGTVENIRRISGPPLLVGAAINAVKYWRYDPPKIDGQPASREATITVDFKMPSRRN